MSESAITDSATKLPRQAKKAAASPTLLTLEVIEWEGRWHCMYLADYRIVGGKPWAGGQAVYTWKVKPQQLRDIVAAAKLANKASVTLEVYQHPNEECAVYLNGVLLDGPRFNSKTSQPRKVGSVIRFLREVGLKDIEQADPSLAP